jgi:hypothetical protein
MADARVIKLASVLGNKPAAETLVAAGLDTPRKIKAASDERLVELGVTEAVARLRPQKAGELKLAEVRATKAPRVKRAKAG